MLETFLMSKELDGWLQPGYEERENIYPKVGKLVLVDSTTWLDVA